MTRDVKQSIRCIAAAGLISVSGVALAGSGGEITLIDFDTVPAGTEFHSDSIELVGNVNVHRRLTVEEIRFPDGSVQLTAPAAASQAGTGTIWVSGDGDPETNGTRLLDAVAGLSPGTSLVKLGPGTFHLGDQSLSLRPGLSLEGSGERLTRIVAFGGSTNARATVEIAEPASLSRLSVESEGGAGPGAPYEHAVAIFIHSTEADLEDVTAIAGGASRLNYAVRIDEADVEIHDVTASSTGGSIAYGITVKNVGEVALKGVEADASGGDENYAVFVINDQFLPGMKVILDRVEGRARGGTASHGLRVIDQADVRISGSTLTASEAVSNYGVSVFSTPPFTLDIDRSTLRAAGVDSYGLHASIASVKTQGASSPVITIDHSTISGEVHSIYEDVGMPILVGATRLEGGPARAEVGELRCVAVYDGEYRPLDDACQ